MKTPYIILIHLVVITLAWGEKTSSNLSIKLEIERSLDLGLDWLSKEQNRSSGNWGLDEYPALTGLAVSSFLGHPSQEIPKKYEKSLSQRD